MKQKLFTLLLAMALLITALPTAVSAAYYPSAKSISENSIYDTLQNYSKENKNPLWQFSVYLTTEKNDTLLMPKTREFYKNNIRQIDGEKDSCIEMISGISMHDAGQYVAGNSKEDSSLTATYGEATYYKGMKTTVLETPDALSTESSLVFEKKGNAYNVNDNQFCIYMLDNSFNTDGTLTKYYLSVNSSGKVEIISGSSGFSKKTVFTIHQDSKDPTLYSISASVNGKTYYLKHTQTGLTTSTTEVKYHIYADIQREFQTFRLYDNYTNVNTGKSPSTYVVVKKDSQIYLPEPASYTDFVCWTRDPNGYSESYKVPFRDFTLPLTQEEIDKECYNYVDPLGYAIDYKPGYDPNLDMDLAGNIYSGNTLYACYQYDLTCTATNLGSNDRLNVRVGNKDNNSYFNADIFDDGKGKVTTGNWVCVAVPSLNACGSTYTIKNVTFKDAKGNTVAAPADYKKAKLNSGAEYIYFKMPNNALKVELELGRTVKPVERESYAYLCNEYGKYTDTASIVTSEKLTMMVQTYYVDADGKEPTVILPFIDGWRGEARNINFDEDKDITTYSITDCKWYVRQGETGEYRLLTEDEYTVKTNSGKKQEIQVTPPEKEGLNTLYYQCRYKIQCDQSGEKSPEQIKTLTANVSGINYCARTQAKNIEKDSVLIINRLKTKNGTEIKLNTFEVSKDNGKTWESFGLLSGMFLYDDARTNPDPDYKDFKFGMAIIGYEDAHFACYNVTENGTYTFRITDEYNREYTFSVTYNNLHQHQWSDSFRALDGYHWRTCTVEGCNAVKDNDYHKLTGNTCDVCGYSDPDIAAAEKVIDKIDALPEEITAKDKDAIIAARSAYNLLTEEQKEKVTNLAKLEAAEEALLKLEKDQVVANKVIAKIDALPEIVSLSDKDAIEAARSAYEALSDSQKALVTNLAKLEAAEKAYAEVSKLPFTDVGEDQWYYEAVKYAYLNSLFNGIDKTTFGPQIEMNRAMLVTVLYRLDGTPPADTTTAFTDVPEDQYYAPAVSWAAANSIVYGVSETEFAPNQNITREQIAAMIMRYAKYKDIDVSAQADLSAYTDQAEISSWAKEAMSWANAAGLIKGRTETTLDPSATATRAEVAQILMRFMETQMK